MSTPAELFESRFTAALWRYPGPGGWVFVPEAFAPAAAGAFGRTPVLARIDGRTAWARRGHPPGAVPNASKGHSC